MKPTATSLYRLLTAALLLATWPIIAQTLTGPKLEIYREGQTTPELTSQGEVIAWGNDEFGQTTVPPAAKSGVIAIAAGGAHTVALKQDGSVIAWGYNNLGPTTVPTAAQSGVIAIAAGDYFTVALTQNGRVIAWGDNRYGQTNLPTAAQSDVIAVAAGGAHTMALKHDGSVIAWGWNFFGQATVPTTAQNGVIALAAGGGHSMSLKQDGSVIAWGDNEYGQTTVPTTAQTGVVVISAGGNHTLTLKQDSSVIAWGSNNSGQVTVPTDAQDGVISISAGTLHSMALKQDGRVIAWGSNSHNLTSIPPAAQNGVIAIAAGFIHAVALKTSANLTFDGVPVGQSSDQLFTIRSAGAGDLTNLSGSITGPDATQFAIVGDPLPATLASGNSVSLRLRYTPTKKGEVEAYFNVVSNDPNKLQIIKLSGTGLAPHLEVTESSGDIVSTESGNHVIAWGDNKYGQTTVPAAVQNGVIAIEAGGGHTVALKQDGSVIAWGWNAFGQTTVPAAAQSGVIAIAAGGAHTVALKQDGSVIAWGATFDGQTTVPTTAQSGVAAIAAGAYHTAALRHDGRMIAWGDNVSGQTTVPKAAKSGIIAVAASGYHTVALTQEGRFLSWGDGQTDVPPAAQSGVTTIAAGAGHSVALKQDGSVVAWGDNFYGQIAVPVEANSEVIATAANNAHTLALKQDGGVIAWGWNVYGQTTLPKATQSGVIAIAAGYGHSVALIENAGDFGTRQLGKARDHMLSLKNAGNFPLSSIRAVIEGSDADQFAINVTGLESMVSGASIPFTLRCLATRVGKLTATLKLYSNDPTSPFILPLQGISTFNLTATKPAVSGSAFTYGPLRLDRQTGLMLQKISFTNTTGVKLEGLKLTLSKVASGVQIYSSSFGTMPGTFEVIYSKAIAAGETISFDLVYFDPQRRTADAISPVIKAEALLEPEPDSLPVAGTEVKLLSLRVTPQGPLLEWNSVPRATYVAEYSDDGGKTWLSAVHRLSTQGSRQFWIDRGQPETKTKPVGTPNKPGGRFYRMKKL